MRPWIAMVAAFALALQVLLGGILATKAEAVGASPDNPFVICLAGDSAAPANHGSDKAPAKHLQCVLCTLAKTSHAILGASEVAAFDIGRFSAVIFRIAERVAQYHSPTGHYQRGPPATIIG
jgi:hypothetical protein